MWWENTQREAIGNGIDHCSQKVAKGTFMTWLIWHNVVVPAIRDDTLQSCGHEV